ncbi:sugar/nucleoside kinase (ribokinase family) [Paenibacillus anaericanus]|uniref:carbohydrate kinase family protein n=1 Tax=Paenibacillus anaericanus TaxID=170367 RepID=UPI0027839B0A|nr:sugar kinase [Paenibacillus anaericanus]MDQ0090096.1 sugar/nucleoside kinase (ribokinase family) [Paenibacillus anaericanus]
MKTVYVLGELNVDMIVTGTDVIPEWNREKLVDSFDIVLGSSSAITACALAGLGMDVRFVSVVGDDEFGNYCIEQLQSKGVNTDGIIKKVTAKTGVTLSLSTPQDRGLLTFMGSISDLAPRDMPESLFEEADHVHFGSYFLQDGMRGHWQGIFERVRENGATTSFDTGWDVRNQWVREGIHSLLGETDLFIPSEEELLHIYGVSTLDEVWPLLPEGHHGVAVKRGSTGATLYGEDKQLVEVNSYKITPIDTTGAGDSFNAGLIHGYLNGKRGQELLLFANACGALSTQRVGGAQQVSSLEEVEIFQITHAVRD